MIVENIKKEGLTIMNKKILLSLFSLTTTSLLITSIHDFKDAHASETTPTNLNQYFLSQSDKQNNAKQSTDTEETMSSQSDKQDNAKQSTDTEENNNDIEQVLNNKDLNNIAKKYQTKNSSDPTIPKGNRGVVKKIKILSY